MDNKIIIGIGILFGIYVSYVIYKIFSKTKAQKQKGEDYDTLMTKILTEDQYKVKGRFDE